MEGLSCFRGCVPPTMGQSFSPSLAQLEFAGEPKKKRKLRKGREIAPPPTLAWGQALHHLLPSCYLPDLPILWHVVPIWAGRALRGGQSPRFTDEEAEARGGERPSRPPSWTQET
uniref:Uncharacterized protein n=1 Tax=Pan troglodytes TaxID=9598 RepID=A0A2I3RB66_PANTR